MKRKSKFINRIPENISSLSSGKVHECSQRCDWCGVLEEFYPPLHTGQLHLIKEQNAQLRKTHPENIERIGSSSNSHGIAPVNKRFRTENIQKYKNPNKQNEGSKLQKTTFSVSNRSQNLVHTSSINEDNKRIGSSSKSHGIAPVNKRFRTENIQKSKNPNEKNEGSKLQKTTFSVSNRSQNLVHTSSINEDNKRIGSSSKSHGIAPVNKRFRKENIQKSKNPNEQNEGSKLQKTTCSVSNNSQNLVHTSSINEDNKRIGSSSKSHGIAPVNKRFRTENIHISKNPNEQNEGSKLQKTIFSVSNRSQNLVHTSSINEDNIRIGSSSNSHGIAPVNKRFRTKNIQKYKNPNELNEGSKLQKTTFSVSNRSQNLVHTSSINEDNKRIGSSSKSHGIVPVNKRFRTENILISKNPNEQNEGFKLQKTTCSVSNCSQNLVHTLSINEDKIIQKLFSTFNFSFNIEPTFYPISKSRKKKSKIAFCDEHLHMINVIKSCQLCSNKVEKLDFNDFKMYDHWNSVLSHNNILLTLQPGMFICLTCKSCVTDNDFLSPLNLQCLQEYVEKKYSERIETFKIVNDATSIAKKSKRKNLKVTFSDPLETFITYTNILRCSTDNINVKKVIKNSKSRLNNKVYNTRNTVRNKDQEPKMVNGDTMNNKVQMNLEEEETPLDYNSIIDLTTVENSDKESDHDENVKNDVDDCSEHKERTRFCG